MIPWRYLKPGWRGTLLGLGCGILAWFLASIPFFRELEERFQDGCFAYRGRRASQARIVIIGLDAASFDALGKPAVFSSPELAEVVSYLKTRGVAAIGIDVIIPQSYAGLTGLQAGGQGDAPQLGQAILAADNVVLPVVRQPQGWLAPLPQWRLKEFLNPSPTDLGFVNWTEDSDYFLRRQQLYVRDDIEARPHFALALAARAQGTTFTCNKDGLFLGTQRVPLDEEQRLRINFVGPPDSIPVIPFYEVLAAARAGTPIPEDLSGALVIIGVTARDQQDYHATPFASSSWLPFYGGAWGLMSGSEIHANIAATLLDRAAIHVLPPWGSLLIVLATAVLLGRAFANLSMTWGLALFFAHHVVWRILCLGLFALTSVRVVILPMLLLGGLAFGVTLLQRWRLLRLMLGVVKSENIARLLEKDPTQLDLHGEERVVTLLFADIRNFTPFAESHSAREVVALLNAYFGTIVPIIERQGGTLNQYMGDGIMVIFGAPAVQLDHALRAVQAAVELVRRVHELRELWEKLGFPGLRMGVGIHTGRVVVGTVGSPRRLDYTAIGDTTNTAARIEAQNKIFGTEILLSSETFQEVPEQERQRLGCRTESVPTDVKGKAHPLQLHIVDLGPSSLAPARPTLSSR